MKRIGVIIMLLCATWAIAADNVKKKVVISQFVDHPALNKTTQGIIDGLAKHGYKRGVNLDLRVESAQANTALATQIAAKLIAQQPDVVVGVATISAQSFVKYTKKNLFVLEQAENVPERHRTFNHVTHEKKSSKTHI